MTALLQLWFGLRTSVSRRNYALSGVSLMAFKLVLDQSLAIASTGKPWPVAAYLLPSITLKSEALKQGTSALGPAPTWTLALMALMALPFLWIGVTMTVRRAADAGVSPWWGLLFFVPLINYLVMLVFAVLPAAKDEQRWVPVALGAFRTPAAAHKEPSVADPPIPPGLSSALLGVLLSVGIGLGMTGLSVYSLSMYGAALFFATPFTMGLATALLYNAKTIRTLTSTLGFTFLSVALTGAAILMFALEGAVCLAMAFPIACAIALLGALLGYGLAKQAKGNAAAYSMFLILPVLAGVESKTATPTLREVTTAIEIDAPPDAVFQHVTSFSELPATPDWFFKLGIAYPIRARIVGEGVGAIRYCEFSTGPFVEPITVWEPGKRLAFDVVAQPPSMKEWSPYAHVNAPHLEGYMVSKRGEFRLIALPGGRTRLEGSTFYTLSIYPEAYWVPWGEALLHRIHTRVLTHVKHLSEQT
jgi:uncharacterized membrane protein YhaH (DUF805 family)